MPSSTKCGVRLTDVLWTRLSGDLTRHFPETIYLSGERPAREERVPYITYTCAFEFFKTLALQKVPPEDQSSGIGEVDKSLLALLGTL
jgi:hypothetical protein